VALPQAARVSSPLCELCGLAYLREPVWPTKGSGSRKDAKTRSSQRDRLESRLADLPSTALLWQYLILATRLKPEPTGGRYAKDRS
jgi:hypothetical protein